MRTKLLTVFILMLFVVAAPFAFAHDEAGDFENGDGLFHHYHTPIPHKHFSIIAKYADRFLSNMDSPVLSPFKFAQPVSGTPESNLSDYYIIDIRGAAAYAANHVPGAVNIPFAAVAKPENLVTYPTDKPLLVICYSGHTASISGGILNTLGYDAHILRGGMSTWKCNDQEKGPDEQLYYFSCEQ